MPSFGEHSFAQRCDHRYEWVMFVDCEMKPEEADEPSKMFLRFVVGSPCSLAPPFIWLVQLWAQGLTWKQGPISLDWYFCPLVSSSLHLYWEAQDLEKNMKIYAWLLSHVRLFVIPWTVAHRAPLSMGILQARILELVATPFSRGSSQPGDATQISRIAGEFFTI